MSIFSTLFYLSGGLFLGWSLGANNLSSLFGTAIGTKMVSFKKAVILASIFVVLGAVLSGSGTSKTLQSLGSITTIAGAFVTSMSAAITIFLMTKAKIPVSATQAIVGSILGWSLYAHMDVNVAVLAKIVLAWFTSPFLAVAVAFLMMFVLKAYLKAKPIPLLYQDAYTRLGLILAGSFSAFAFGANNIANVMGPFIGVIPFTPTDVGGLFTLRASQQLLFIGSLAIVVGMFTYSKGVIKTIGDGVLKMSPIEAFVVILTHGIVLVLFSSVTLQSFLLRHGLPAFPLVPISSTGAIIGGVVGVSAFKRFQGLSFKELSRVLRAWVVTPVYAAILCYIALFFMENVFNQKVF